MNKHAEEKTIYVFDSEGNPAEIYNSETEATQKQKSVFDWCSSVMASFVVIFIIFCFFFRVVQVSGESMLQTLQHKDWLLISSVGNIEFGDIVVATPPTYKGGPVIKRVIGVGGDEIYIDFDRGEVLVNGVVLDEPYKGLDEETRARVMAIVARYTKGKTVILVTHDREEAPDYQLITL